MDEADPQPEPDAVDLVFAVEPIWLIVARVVGVRPHGPGGAQTRNGLKLFAPGAKVYVVGGHWGMGLETVTVVGHHRRSAKYILADVESRHLVDWRVDLIYSPYVIRTALHGPSNNLWPDEPEERRRQQEALALRFNDRPVEARLVGGPLDGEHIALGPGQPPAQLLRPHPAHPVDAVRYLLRSNDAERAHYDHTPSSADAAAGSDRAGTAAGDAAVQRDDGAGEVGAGA